MPRPLLAALAIAIATACMPFASPSGQTPAATERPGAARPTFDSASYAHALQVRGKIRVGILDDNPPFATRDPSGARDGFEVDLARELAKSIFGPQRNVDSVIEWVSVGQPTTVSALIGLQADVVLARVTATDERRQAIDLSEEYLVTGERILVRGSEIKDLADLDARTVCVQRGTETDVHIREANRFAKTLPLDTYAACLGALQRGQVDALGADEAVLWGLLRQDPNTTIVGQYVTTDRYGIGLKKNVGGDREGLLAFVNTWIAAVVSDGTWARLYAQHVTPFSGDRRTTPAR
jgi:polar amino acid transport system substrate-binding protein